MTVDLCIINMLMLVLMALNVTLNLKTFVRLVLFVSLFFYFFNIHHMFIGTQ